MLARKGSDEPLVMVTAYDAPSARIVDDAGVDMILVGDSLAMVVLGYDDTLQVTTDDMAHHVAAVARTRPRGARRRRPAVAQLPRQPRARPCATRPRSIRAGAGAVKLEGGRKRIDAVGAILDAEIPVMGHIGLTPQSIHALGGFKVQGKQLDAARELVDDAVALADAGCFAIVLECVPDGVARMVTETVPVPTIGIGAGRHCDGQVLVWHDLLGLRPATGARSPKFVRAVRGARGRRDRARSTRFCADVRDGPFPSSAETYHMTDQMADALGLYGGTDAASPSSRRSAAAVASARVVDGVVIAIALDGCRGRVSAGRYRPVGAATTDDRVTADPEPGTASPTRLARRRRPARRSRAHRERASRSAIAACASWSPTRATSGSQGLRNVTDLGPYDGMLFVFDADTDAAVHDVADALPLDIGWYAADGTPVDSRAMTPCPDGPTRRARCTRRAGRYRYALETEAGAGASRRAHRLAARVSMPSEAVGRRWLSQAPCSVRSDRSVEFVHPVRS